MFIGPMNNECCATHHSDGEVVVDNAVRHQVPSLLLICGCDVDLPAIQHHLWTVLHVTQDLQEALAFVASRGKDSRWVRGLDGAFRWQWQQHWADAFIPCANSDCSVGPLKMRFVQSKICFLYIVYYLYWFYFQLNTFIWTNCSFKGLPTQIKII